MTSEWTKQVFDIIAFFKASDRKSEISNKEKLEDNFNFSQNEKEDPPRQPDLFATKEGSGLQFKNPHIEIKFVGGLLELPLRNTLLQKLGYCFN